MNGELAGDTSHVTSQGKLALRCLCWALFMGTGCGRRTSRARKSYMEQMGASYRATSLCKSERSAPHSRTTAITSTQFISTLLTRRCVVWLAITNSFILCLAYLPTFNDKDRRWATGSLYEDKDTMIFFTLHKSDNQCYGSLFPLSKTIQGNCDIKIEKKKKSEFQLQF